MKKLLLSFVLLIMAITSQAQTYHLDTNNDGSIELTDALIIINYILGRFNPEDNQRPQSYLTCPDNHHPHLIDLGLLSGTKWACCNVGATTPEGYGGYYAWGETEEKSVYNEVTYQYCTGEDFDGDGLYDLKKQWQSLGDDISGMEYDVAHVKWGGSWVMPSKDQLEELISNCTYKWTTENGVNGGKLTSNINGASIFLPAASFRLYDNLYFAGSNGYYWTSSQNPADSSSAYRLFFLSGYVEWGSDCRIHGFSVRPVVIETPLTHLQLSQNSVDMLSGEVTTVEITSGNGKYFVGSSNLNVAKATVKNGQVTITAGGASTATITVTDITSSETATITVRVTDNLVINGNCESDDVTCLWGRDGDADNYDNGVNTHFVEDGGFNGSRGIRVQSIDNAQCDWETQFFVYTPNHVWKTGEHYRFKMMYRADKPATISTQSHGKPGRYLHYETFGNLQAELDWQEFEFEGEVSSVQDGMQTIAFLLNVSKEANNYYFDDISWVLMDTEIPLVPLQLSQDCITTIEGENTNVEITSGSGNYSVESSDESITTATIQNKAITVTAVGAGTATITVTDTKSHQTATITVTVTAAQTSNLTCPDDHHPHMIDLGLPSGTLWACCNVDTDHPENQKPENYGGYYAWGDTYQKDVYDWDNYGYYMIGNDPIEGTMCDVAHVTWGSEWFMPSYEQLQELQNKCTHEREVLNQVVGYRFTGSNGGSIFLPAAGCYLGSKCYELNEGCHYWSGTPYYECGDCEADDTQANCLTVIDGDYIDVLFTYRSAGLSVRPVITKDAPVE